MTVLTGRSGSRNVKATAHAHICTEGEGDYPEAALQGPLLMTHKDGGSVHSQRVVCLSVCVSGSMEGAYHSTRA